MVGGDRATFEVHKELICQHSRFFKTACHGDWKEAQDKTVKLPDDKPTIFRIYMGWLYRSEIAYGAEEDVQGSALRYQTENKRLLEAWVFGHKYQDYRFTNAIMDTMIEGYARGAWVGDYDHSAIVHANTVDGSPLRKFLVEVWGCRASHTAIELQLRGGDYQAAFGGDLIHFLVSNRRNLTPLFCKGQSMFHVKE